MSTTVKRTIFLPVELARRAEMWARADGKTLSAVILDAMRQATIERRLRELRGLQKYWSRKAQSKKILKEIDLARHFRT